MGWEDSAQRRTKRFLFFASDREARATLVCGPWRAERSGELSRVSASSLRVSASSLRADGCTQQATSLPQDLRRRRLCSSVILAPSQLLPACPGAALRAPVLGTKSQHFFHPAKLRVAKTGGSPLLASNRCNQAISLSFSLSLSFLTNSHDKRVCEGGQPAPGVLHFNRDRRRSWIHKTITPYLSPFPSNWTLQKGGCQGLPSH